LLPKTPKPRINLSFHTNYEFLVQILLHVFQDCVEVQELALLLDELNPKSLLLVREQELHLESKFFLFIRDKELLLLNFPLGLSKAGLQNALLDFLPHFRSSEERGPLSKGGVAVGLSVGSLGQEGLLSLVIAARVVLFLGALRSGFSFLLLPSFLALLHHFLGDCHFELVVCLGALEGHPGMRLQLLQ